MTDKPSNQQRQAELATGALTANARISELPPSKLSKLDAERARALQDARDGLAFMVEFYQIEAKQKRAKFLSLVREGFSEPQALELCK